MNKKKYDSEQREAIKAMGGYYLVLAPPGCGKTDILSQRIVKAHELGVPFDQMICLTFTNRASRGMLDRIKDNVGEDSRNIFVGNVHRFCSHFLYDNACIPENSSIIDDDDMTDILISFDPYFFLTPNNDVDRMKLTMIDNIDAYIQQRRLGQPKKAIYMPSNVFEQYYQTALNADFNHTKVALKDKLVHYALRYRQYKTERNIISFSDILIQAYERLRRDSKHNYRRYKWIQVDEVQDLNALQMAIIDELLDTSGDFTAMYLGDEQQAIFSFLGAKLGQLQMLKKRCQGHLLTLGTNYRSPKYLLDIFNTYAEKVLQVDTSILPHSTNLANHERHDLILTGNTTERDECNRVCKMVQHYLQFDNERIAILVPTNKAADRISKILSSNSITHFKISGADLFKTKSYKTLSSIFCVGANPFNNMAWSRLLYGIGAIHSGAIAREFLVRLKSLMMTPFDLMDEESYVERFHREYRNREFVLFDTETTGLDVLEDEIVQIAAFKVRDGKRVAGSDFNILIHTDRPLPEKVGGKENPLIKLYADNPHLERKEGLRMFLDYVGDCPLLGHNVRYDYRILRSNVEKTLNEQIDFDIYDSLHLIKCVEPNLHRYKLGYLLEELHLEGSNSHLADEDIAATLSLVDYCIKKSQLIIPEQKLFRAKAKIRNIVAKMEQLQPLFNSLNNDLYQPISHTGRTLADELKSLYDKMLAQKMVESLGNKFNIFLQFVRQQWVNPDIEETLYDQIDRHMTDMTGSINEGDLVNSEGLIDDRVFVMTVHKGKGLEFENVVVLNANLGTYPFYRCSKEERMEDARKFYVAITRAKKRLCISYTLYSPHGYQTVLTPFMKPIEHFFNA